MALLADLFGYGNNSISEYGSDVSSGAYESSSPSGAYGIHTPTHTTSGYSGQGSTGGPSGPRTGSSSSSNTHSYSTTPKYGTQITSLQQNTPSNTSNPNSPSSTQTGGIKLPTIKELQQGRRCPTGYYRKNGQGPCVKINKSAGNDVASLEPCPSGQIRMNGVCVKNNVPAPCPAGQVRMNGVCVKNNNTGNTTTGNTGNTNTGGNNNTNTGGNNNTGDNTNTNTNVICQDGTIGNGTSTPCIEHGGIKQSEQQLILNQLINLFNSSNVTCQDGTKGNGTSTPCIEHGGIAGTGTVSTGTEKNYLPIVIVGALIVGLFTINKVLKS